MGQPVGVPNRVPIYAKPALWEGLGESNEAKSIE